MNTVHVCTKKQSFPIYEPLKQKALYGNKIFQCNWQVRFPTEKKKKSKRNVTVVPSRSTSFLKFDVSIIKSAMYIQCGFSTQRKTIPHL